MTPAAQILLSGTLTFGVPLALAVRELIVLRRRPGGPGWQPEPPAPTPPPPTPIGGPAIRPLPECLILAARTNRVRELA